MTKDWTAHLVLPAMFHLALTNSRGHSPSPKSHPLWASVASKHWLHCQAARLYHSRSEGGPLRSSQSHCGFYFNFYSWLTRCPLTWSPSVSQNLILVSSFFTAVLPHWAFPFPLPHKYQMYSFFGPLSDLLLSKCSSLKPQNGGSSLIFRCYFLREAFSRAI